MCFGNPDSGAAERAAEKERKKIEAERALEKMQADQKMLADKKALAAKEAADQLRGRQLLGSMSDEEEYDPLDTSFKKKPNTLLSS